MGATIKDVAKAAGTSVSTVSKVLNGHYSISEETAQRVRKVMKELNYYPSASAQSIAKGTTKIVTVLTSLSPNTAFQNPHMVESLQACHFPVWFFHMVGVVQLVEHRIVVPSVAGSSPVTHPINAWRKGRSVRSGPFAIDQPCWGVAKW